MNLSLGCSVKDLLEKRQVNIGFRCDLYQNWLVKLLQIAINNLKLKDQWRTEFTLCFCSSLSIFPSRITFLINSWWFPAFSSFPFSFENKEISCSKNKSRFDVAIFFTTFLKHSNVLPSIESNFSSFKKVSIKLQINRLLLQVRDEIFRLYIYQHFEHDIFLWVVF